MKNILFVDDEPLVLNSIKRMMRKERHRWNAHFANGGKDALEFLNSRHFDLLVTDMKMPLVDGTQVLEEAEAVNPSMPRIALSGYSEKEIHVRSSNLANRFLNKPCESDEIRSALEALLEETA